MTALEELEREEGDGRARHPTQTSWASAWCWACVVRFAPSRAAW